MLTNSKIRKGLFLFKERNDFTEKLRLKDGTEFDLIPMGVSETGNRRNFTIYSANNPENVFTESNVDRIEYVSESGEVLKIYLDGVKAVGINKDIENGTYTVAISVDALEKKLKQIIDSQTYSELALIEVYELLLGVMM